MVSIGATTLDDLEGSLRTLFQNTSSSSSIYSPSKNEHADI